MSGGTWWTSLEEWADSGSLEQLVNAEFPSLFDQLRVDRRELLRVMGASLALSGVTGCKPARSDEVVPFVTQPDGFDGDGTSHYATAVLTDGFAQPVIATTSAGRPIKLEGNPEHPMSGGATSFLAQAALLDLYDPDRSKVPLIGGNAASWADFDSQMERWRKDWQVTGGAGLRLLVAPTTSPTLVAQIGVLKAALPKVRTHLFDPLGDYSTLPPPVHTLLRLERAKVVVSIDDDFLGAGPAQVANARGWAKRRGDVANGDRIRLFMAEPTPTLTGANAQQRIAVAPSRLALLGKAIAAALGVGPPVAGLTPAEFAWTKAASDALLQSGAQGLLTTGNHMPELQPLAAAVNRQLGSEAVDHLEGVALQPDSTFAELGRDIEASRVSALFILGANPAYGSPGDIDFAGLCGRVPLKVHAGLHADETAALCDWHLPLPHSLEDWSDSRAVDGLVTIAQPLIQPLYDTRSLHSVVAGFTSPAPPPSASEIVRTTWSGKLDGEAWNAALKAGFVSGTQARPESPASQARVVRSVPTKQGEIEIVIRPDPTVRSGEGANNGWLQELPKPLTKLTWDNVVALSPATARDLGVSSGDNVEVFAEGSVTAPAWIMPGQPDGVATVYLGYGRKAAGRVGNGVGYDAFPLRSLERPWFTSGRIRRAAGAVVLATTQAHHRPEGGEEVPWVPSAQSRYREPIDRTTIYPGWKQDELAWGMVIDEDLCIGCNACISACQAENNVPVVGKAQVYEGREMHWLRVSRLYTGHPDNPGTAFRPVPCMHCEQAPCEMGCPVHATVHSPDGLNLMVYNRCIGTRTCSSYCPYKVRRFNWFDYTTGAPPAIEAQRNPDVTVRGRGVMEKCTYCIQRIEGAKVQADIDNREVRDGEVQTACQQACPTSAIAFGNLADAGSAVARRRSSPRNYALLDELGTRPRTTYLARVRREDEA